MRRVVDAPRQVLKLGRINIRALPMTSTSPLYTSLLAISSYWAPSAAFRRIASKPDLD